MILFFKKYLSKFKNNNESCHILLVEDNKVSRMMAINVLESIGFFVDEVENGSLALQAVQKKKYDLVLMDVHMPVMNGYEATENIISLVRKRVIKALPVIALTADTKEDDRAHCIAAGMADYITKPIKKDEMSMIVSRYLNSKKLKTI